MGSVFTNWPGSQVVTRTTAGNIVNFGVREFAMAAISNGWRCTAASFRKRARF
jgi:transketolase